MEQELVEVTILGSANKRRELIDWAKEMFNDDVEEHETLPLLYFKNVADAEWFALRWL
jgi:hypothetical protein